MYYTAKDVSEILKCSRSKAYQFIKSMNDEMEAEGFFVLPGKVPIKKFEEKFPYVKKEVNS